MLTGDGGIVCPAFGSRIIFRHRAKILDEFDLVIIRTLAVVIFLA